MLRFVWDEQKDRQNEKKHGIAFADALSVFGDPLSLTIPDLTHSSDEERFVIIGRGKLETVVVVAHTEQAGQIRIISARSATKRERRCYEEET